MTPRFPTSVDSMTWQDATYEVRAVPGELDGRPVGVGTTGRIYMFQPTSTVLGRSARAAGRAAAGRRIRPLRAISQVAHEAGKTHLHLPASTAWPDAIAFLEHRGFVVYDRWKVLALNLVGREPPGVEVRMASRSPHSKPGRP